ncbi:MAG: hypothetical protein NC347_11240 [Clostridium sp.]|nr:hypothetical protein [Clostridium sp.]
MKIKKKSVVLAALFTIMAFCCLGCSGGANEIVGTYSGTTGQTKGTRSSTFVFESDGTCSYEYVHAVSGEGGITETYTGVWDKSEDNDEYEIMVNELGSTLYGKILDSGDIIISSDGNGWSTETFSKE